jgi:YHS domain-containing protein
MLEFLLPLLYLVAASALWRLVGGIAQGLSTGPQGPSGTTVRMARDPVCGTYVVPGRALTIADGGTRLYFCSSACRDKYRARTA